MEDYTRLLTEQLDQIDDLIVKAEKRLKDASDVKSAAIKTAKRNNGYQYYYVNENGKRVYVRKKDLIVVKQIIQKAYDRIVLKSLQANRNNLRRFLDHYRIYDIHDAYQKMGEGRKTIIDPITPTDEMVIRDWEERIKGNMNPYPQQTSYQTNRGESVRSKSEKILADLFYQYQIPYCYEPQLNLSDGTSLYPDFALLNVKKRKTIYWEHFGLVSDGDYAVRTLRKLMLYEKNGMMIGKNLLYSLESNEMPLDIKKLEKKVREYLM